LLIELRHRGFDIPGALKNSQLTRKTLLLFQGAHRIISRNVKHMPALNHGASFEEATENWLVGAAKRIQVGLIGRYAVLAVRPSQWSGNIAHSSKDCQS
jgi:hypothetical protein